MKNQKKFLALFLIASLVASLCSGCSSTAAADSGEVTAIQNALDEWDSVSELVNHSDTSGKEETVYAFLSADGAMKQTLVSEWLKNPDGATTLTDKTALSDITVVKGDAQYSKKDSGNQIVWTNNGSDIYYQGNTDQELPVDVHISYELDGKKVTADELTGASGHLKITFTYTNKLSKEIKMHGEKQTIYQPFVMISGLLLENSKAQNVIVKHGNIVNTGDDTVILGIAFPGLKESLGLDNITNDNEKLIDFDIPEEVTVEADVSDFSLMMTLTIASNTALSQLGLDDMDGMDDVKADLNQLTNGMNDIVDGSTQLNDGATELKDGTASLSAGTQTLSNGTTSLSEGARSLSDGAAKVNNGAVSLKNGLNQLKENSSSLTAGVSFLTTGTDQLSSGLDTIIGNNESLNTGASQIADGLSSLHNSLNKEDNKQQLQSLLSGSSTFSQGLTQTSDGLSQIVDGYDYNSENLAVLITELTQYARELTASGDPTNITYAGYIQTILETYKKLYNDIATAESGINNLSDSYHRIDSGIHTAANNISTVSQTVEALSSGAAQLKKGIASYTVGVSQASNAVKTLDNGLNSLNAQIPAFVNGINQLSDGATNLAAGTGSLSDGATSLASGADQLDHGASALKEGVLKLLEGITELTNGTGTLKDGVIQFNDEGIQKLANIINKDLDTYYDRLKAIQEFAKEYTSYAGCEDNVECNVKFIYKTDAIE